MLGILVPYSVLMNSILYGESLYGSWVKFFSVLMVTLFIKCVSWQFHTYVAVYLRARMPMDAQIMRRMLTALLLFFVMTAVDGIFITWLFHHYQFQGFVYRGDRFLYVILSGMVLNLFATLFHEGASNFEKWRAALTETEQLRTAYIKSQLEGLKNQIKPHFLFNSINTLSALIGEDGEKAEAFLDELCKVYRYLLKNDGQFITLAEELAFVGSYFYVLKARYGQAIELHMDIHETETEKLVPPFTLQLLLENALHNNVVSKKMPLRIYIGANGDGQLLIENSVSTKIKANLEADEGGLRNVINKFRLLGIAEISIQQLVGARRIQLPLVIQKNLEI